MDGLQAIVEMPKFEVWKTIKLGTGIKDAEGFRNALKDSGMQTNKYASHMLGRPEFVVAEKETEIDLVVVSLAELGFKDGARRDQIYDRAKELGLELCPAEVGPQLRLQYKDQPIDESLSVAMEPIVDSDGSLRVFGIEHAMDYLWLSTSYGHYKVMGPDYAGYIVGADPRLLVFSRK